MQQNYDNLNKEENIDKVSFKSHGKGILDLIREDEGLSKKVTYEEFKKESHGVDDSSLEEAYKEYEAFVDTHDIKPKGLEDYLRDDSSLLEKVSIDKIRGKK